MDTASVGNLINLGIFIATAGGLVAVVYQLREGARSQSEENERKKASDTLAFYDNFRKVISENNRNLLKELRSVPGEEVKSTKPMSSSHVAFLMNVNNKETRSYAIESLRLYERLAVGINNNIYDFNIIYNLSRSELTGKFGFYAPYIKEVRKRTTKAYCEFEALAKSIDNEAQRKSDNVGKGYQAAREQGLLPIK